MLLGASMPRCVVDRRRHFFIDPSREIGVVVMIQTLPFCDEASMKGYAGVEAAVYRNLKLVRARGCLASSRIRSSAVQAALKVVWVRIPASQPAFI
jgi:hypothetical protein